MIVVDLGCADQNNPLPSLERLVGMFRPDKIYGFDPNPTLNAGITDVLGVPCELSAKAAWLWDGEVGFHDAGTGSHVGGDRIVPCFDFAQWLWDLGERTVLKMDIEGAEWALIGQLKLTKADSLIDTLLVEWHQPDCTIETWEW